MKRKAGAQPAARKPRKPKVDDAGRPTRLQCWQRRASNNAFAHIQSNHRPPMATLAASDLGPRNAMHGLFDMERLELRTWLQGDLFPAADDQLHVAEIPRRFGEFIRAHGGVFGAPDAMVIERQLGTDPLTDRMEVGLATYAAARGLPFEVIDPEWRKKMYADFFTGVGHEINKKDAMDLVERILTPAERGMRDAHVAAQKRKALAHKAFGKRHKTEWDDFADMLLYALFFASAVLDRDLVAERLERYAGVPHEKPPLVVVPPDIDW
ncbi:MAG TPA: hypothetical protein VKD22_01950 [Ramlibacter sp.]|nr:hypothetical protein [Ramlibacter sp.]